ncbi:MAG: flagellar biosynthetic protein FliR [bacterium]
MFDFITFGADRLQVLLLVIIRTSGLFLMAPIFSHNDLPKLIKLGLLLVIAILLVAAMPSPQLEVADSAWSLTGLALKELLVGFVIGLVFRLLFLGVHTAGSIVGYQMGLAMVTQFDANLAAQVSVLGRLWFIVAMLIFLAIDGHHLIINALASSYELMPAGYASMPSGLGELIIKDTAFVFVIALKIAAPLMISLFMTDVALGTIAKTMPTMNVFFFGIPIKIGVGLTVMALSLPMVNYILRTTLGYFDQQVQTILIAMGRA